MTICCFIDYDNLTDLNKRNGILDVITRILDFIEYESFDSLNRLKVRLYGGWYDENSNLTSNAQLLSNEIDRDFPKILNLNSHQNEKKINCSAELAFSLVEMPGDLLHSTFREKSGPPVIKCPTSAQIECLIDDCFADKLSYSFKKKKCINVGCEKKLSDFVIRREQKMVDTLLVCDMNFTSDKYDLAVLVSSDDDFVPLIKTYLNRNRPILLVETKPNSNQIGNKFNLTINSKTL